MTRWLVGALAGCLLGAVLALVLHFEHSTGCSTRPLKSGGTVTVCGTRGNLTAILLPSLLVGAGLGLGAPLLSAPRED